MDTSPPFFCGFKVSILIVERFDVFGNVGVCNLAISVPHSSGCGVVTVTSLFMESARRRAAFPSGKPSWLRPA